jgi:UDPglucose 6-dehydrogenase
MAKNSLNIVQIGCGVVGKAYVDAYKKVDCNVVGIEASKKLIDMYKDEMTIYHIDDDMSNLRDIDFVMISICTPLKGEKLDLSYLFSSIKNVSVIAKNNPDVIVILRSTVPPGTTKKYRDELEKVVGAPVKVLFQPEFLRAVSAREDAINPWHVVIGIDFDSIKSKYLTNSNSQDMNENNLYSLDVLDFYCPKILDLYCRFVSKDDISILNIEESELMKMYHNSYNAMKISYTNHCDTLNQSISATTGASINTNKIFETMVKTCEGLRNPKYGTKAGHAYYGTCLPKDSAELASLEKEYGLEVPLFDCVVKVNDEIKKTDKEEILVGDFHVSHSAMSKRG